MSCDELSGRALDAAVANLMFGHLVEERTSKGTLEKDFVYALRPEGPDRQFVRVPFYSGSMGASITVELALRDRGWTRTEPHERVSGAVRVVLKRADGRTVEAFGPLNEALCRAALMALTL
jgi:hypothetical protein